MRIIIKLQQNMLRIIKIFDRVNLEVNSYDIKENNL